MQGKASRAGISAGLVPEQWVILFQKEDPTEDAVFNSRVVGVALQADYLNQGNVEYILQESANGTTWTNVVVGANPIVPGGQVMLQSNHTQRWVRVVLFSHAIGRIDATVIIEEDQVIPALWPDVGAMSCAAYCEVSAES